MCWVFVDKARNTHAQTKLQAYKRSELQGEIKILIVTDVECAKLVFLHMTILIKITNGFFVLRLAAAIKCYVYAMSTLRF